MWQSYRRWGLWGSDKFSVVLHSITVFWKRNSWQLTVLGLLNLRLRTPELVLLAVLNITLLVTWGQSILGGAGARS